MSEHIGNMIEHIGMRAKRANPVLVSLFVGELKGYNPADHTVEVYLPHADGSNSSTLQPYRMPLMVGVTGPNYGDQDGPDTTGQPLQVIVASTSQDGDDYIALGFCYTANQLPPGAPATELWRVDKRGSSLKMTADGGTVGDGVGGLKTVAAGYHAAQAGPTGAAHTDVMDVANRVITRTSAGGSQHIIDDNAQEVSSLAPNVTLGARLATLTAANAAYRNVDATTFEANLFNSRLQDKKDVITALISAMGTSGVPSLPTAVAAIAALASAAHIAVPAGSSVVKIVN